MIYDCIVIGAGPGGLSATIYLGRAHKKTLLIHRGPGRTSHAIHINNFLGLDDISGYELVEGGIKQAQKYGAEVILATVRDVVKDDVFKVVTSEGIFSSKYLIVASGINDIMPDIDNISDFLGETFFTCFDCDGYRMSGKNAWIIGKGDGVARTALAVRQTYTDKITISTGFPNHISFEYMNRLKKKGIRIVQQNIKHLNGENGVMQSIVLDDGSVHECDCILSDLGYERNDSFLLGLNLKRSRTGYIEVNPSYESSIPGLFVVGPINTGTDQISVAVGEGAVAAMHIIESGFDLGV